MTSTPIRLYVLTIQDQESARVPSFKDRLELMPAYDAADAQAQWRCSRFGLGEHPRDPFVPLQQLKACRPLDPEGDPVHKKLLEDWGMRRDWRGWR